MAGNLFKARAKEAEKEFAVEQKQEASKIPLAQEPVQVAQKTYDFRELPEPERTSKRLEAFLLDQRFTHGEHAAGALLILAFQNVPPDEARLVSVRQLLSDARGFSATTRTALLRHMKEFRLMEEVSFKQKVGTELKLIF